MRTTENTVRSLPDIAKEAQPHVAGALDWVGMGEIQVPVSISNADGRTVQSGARVTAFVNLAQPDARGIHMSRLYLHVDKSLSNEPLTPCSLRRLLKDFLDSHAELSDRALIRIAFDHLVRRPALVSDNSGWKSYPIVLTALMERGQFSLELAYEVIYSSTCPCSAALARQLIQERFGEDFARGRPLDYDQVMAWLGSEQGICATPHSQRSSAEIRVKLVQGFELPIIELIDRVENALQTPVQTAVKRVDEQAFARLNGENLMFCEDAARRVQHALAADERIVDFWVRASHYESLHPHNAVAVATKGVTGGYCGGMDPFAPLRR
ncbi:GTP cyclohydrolase FolE2 [Tahibacter sp.]|uniref:GTP cyclohydrolase FolE2 n=1 Tax=Tahibacter sp. TaxID=2056211 RepID=UPI0028C38ECE|nr:GTP cyclohydrolase FolE2 [Tahibacter sp.]